MNPDIRILLAIHGERGGNFDVGVIEIGQLGLPARLFKVEEDGAEDGRIIQIGFYGRYVGRRHVRSRLGRILIVAAEPGRAEAARSARSAAETAPAAAVLLQ